MLAHLLCALRAIGKSLRDVHFTADKLGVSNTFGDHQLDVDVKSDALIFEALKDSKLVAVASSEENPVEVECGGNDFSVAFDPLDGSSIIDANFAVGTIMGIYPGRGFLQRTGREQCCALIAQYGPRVTIAIAFNGSITKDARPTSFELTMLPDSWAVSILQLTIAAKCSTFAPGNLRATADNAKYKSLVDYWIDRKYTLRYSGGLVPDVYHIFIKQGGVLSNASSKTAKAKLRLLFECAPIALIIEAAGGHSCVCPSEFGESLDAISILDLPITELDRRIGVCYGSSEEVDRFKSYIFSS